MCVFKGVVKKKNRGLGLPRGARSLCVYPTGYRLHVLVGLLLRKDDQDGAVVLSQNGSVSCFGG